MGTRRPPHPLRGKILIKSDFYPAYLLGTLSSVLVIGLGSDLASKKEPEIVYIHFPTIAVVELSWAGCLLLALTAAAAP